MKSDEVLTKDEGKGYLNKNPTSFGINETNVIQVQWNRGHRN